MELTGRRLLSVQRLFLGVTFSYAGAQKLADPHFPAALAAAWAGYGQGSPLGPLLRALTGQVHPLAYLLAVAELFAGLATLTGVAARAGAAVGALLSLTFWLTVSWHVRPFYYGSDLVFLVCWLPLLTLPGRWLPVRSTSAADSGRRALLLRYAPAAGLGVLLAAVGGGAAGLGRALRRQPPAAGPTAIGPAGDLPVGQALSFTDPITGRLGFAVQPAAGSYRAFSGVCTHAQCLVQWQPQSGRQGQFYCPCHGSLFDGATGEVLRGPAMLALPAVPVELVRGMLQVPPPGRSGAGSAAAASQR